MAIRFRTNHRKALEAILWLANKEPGIDVHRILKILFFADARHLNEFGRPILGDSYCALPHGPAPMQTYDILERKSEIKPSIGLENEEFPFEVRDGPRRKHVFPIRESLPRFFSKSDIKILKWAYSTYGPMDFSTLSRLSHEHRAWLKGKDAPGLHMDYADFLDGENRSPERLEELEDIARFVVC